MSVGGQQMFYRFFFSCCDTDNALTAARLLAESVRGETFDIAICSCNNDSWFIRNQIFYGELFYTMSNNLRAAIFGIFIFNIIKTKTFEIKKKNAENRRTP